MRFFLVIFLGFMSLEARSQETIARMECISGSCFYKKRGSALVLPIEQGTTISVGAGDLSICIGQGSRAEVIFEDQSRVYLRDTGLYRVQKGQKDLILAQGNEIDHAPTRANRDYDIEGKGNLVYIGGMAVKFIAPNLEEKIIFSSFPQTLRVVFEVEKEQLGNKRPADLKEWQLFEVLSESKIKEPLDIVEFEILPMNDSKMNFSLDLTIPREGVYSLAPQSKVFGGNEGAIQIEVGGKKALKESIRNMLKKATDEPDAGIEVRGF